MGAVTVADVMTTRVVTVAATTPFKEIVVELLAERRISALPVVDAAGRVLGVVSEGDLLRKQEQPHAADQVPLLRFGWRRAARAKATGAVARELMTTPAVAIGPDATLAEAARRMLRRGIRRLPVVDTDGRLLGLVSRADLLGVFLRSDQELRTEILDGVIRHELLMDSGRFDVKVHRGVVVLQGEIERRGLIPVLVRAIRELSGVVRVEERLTWTVDDTIPAARRLMPYGP
jgi:CBS domain-containing protein